MKRHNKRIVPKTIQPITPVPLDIQTADNLIADSTQLNNLRAESESETHYKNRPEIQINDPSTKTDNQVNDSITNEDNQINDYCNNVSQHINHLM